jgi:uncharacterized protein (TIGR03382 family)
MTPGEWLLLGGGAAIGAALALLSVLAVLRRRRRADSSGPAGTGDLRRLGRRIRQLERIARRTEERLNSRMDELRRLLAEAERVTGGSPARAGGGDAAGPADPPSAPLPAFLQSQRDQVLRLSLQGLEPLDIARRLDMPVGEVELTLKLHEQEAHARQAAGGA